MYPKKYIAAIKNNKWTSVAAKLLDLRNSRRQRRSLTFFYFIAYVLSESPNNFDAPRPFQSPVSHINILAECSCAKYISELISPFLKGKANNVLDQTLHFCSSKIRHSKLELSGATDNFCKFVRTAYGVM